VATKDEKVNQLYEFSENDPGGIIGRNENYYKDLLEFKIFETDRGYSLFVLPAGEEMSIQKIRSLLNENSIRNIDSSEMKNIFPEYFNGVNP